MEHKRVVPVLLAVLLTACVIVSVIIISKYRQTNFVPADSVSSIISILEADGITVDRSAVSREIARGTVYRCESAGYGAKVAELLGVGSVRSTYVTPDGEATVLENGGIIVFGNDFSIRYSKSGDTSGFGASAPSVSEAGIGEYTADWAEAARAAREFVDRGSSSFKSVGGIELDTVVQGVAKKDQDFYVTCTRTLDDVEVTGNEMLCVVREGEVIEAEGTWNFLVPGETSPVRMVNVPSILFNARGDIVSSAGAGNGVKILRITRCYTMLYDNESSGFFLVPCWKIDTDIAGEFIYNGINGEFCTKKQ